MSSSTFGALGAPGPIVAALSARGIDEPFPIQAAVIPDALDGADVIGRAPTGGGKTLAFGIPMIAGLASAQPCRPTGLVLAPTRELAEQIAGELAPLAEKMGRAVTAIYGGVGYKHQRNALQAGVDLVVACPGRLEDLLSTGALSMGDVGFVVVDEADRMADMGFLPAVKRIVEGTSRNRQTLLFSATLDKAVTKLSAELQNDAVRHEVGPKGSDLSNATHLFWKVQRENRVGITAEIAARSGSVMVFCGMRHAADRIARQLSKHGIEAAVIHGGRNQNQRDRALQAFIAGRAQALVATDVAARGVHVDNVAAVVHFDPPEDNAAYIHRSGRTARAGASGVVISLWEPAAVRTARKLQQLVGVEAEITEAMPEALGDRIERAAPARKEEPRQERRDAPRRSDRSNAQRDDSRRGTKGRDGQGGRDRDGSRRGDRNERHADNRNDRNRDDRNRDDRNRSENGDRNRNDRNRNDANRDDRGGLTQTPRADHNQGGGSRRERARRRDRDSERSSFEQDERGASPRSDDRGSRHDRDARGAGRSDRRHQNSERDQRPNNRNGRDESRAPQGGRGRRELSSAHAKTGVLLSFSDNGFGFIDAGGRNDLFVHHSNVSNAIRPGQQVKFHVRDGRRGPEAVDVRPV